jgi:glutamate-5-semialdehyde dehydrogenase
MNRSELKKVKCASRTLNLISEEKKNEVLNALANLIDNRVDQILSANQKDLDQMDKSNPKYDRLLLNEERLHAIANDIRNVASLSSPLGKVLEERILENGIQLSRVSVPIGVIGIIYEARPNVSFDVFSLCFKSGNAIVLKGGADAASSNSAISSLIHEVLNSFSIDRHIVHSLPSTREAVSELLGAVGTVDLIIPRGGKGLIDYVRSNAKVPVIETGAGIVHTYIDEEVDLDMAAKVILNAKTRRVSVCNALDTLIVHEKQLSKLPTLLAELGSKQVVICADEPSYAVLQNNYPKDLLQKATQQDFGTEFLSLKMSVKTVSNLTDAIDHITTFSSKHSEAILSSNKQNIELFFRCVDAAVVYSNASTSFTDGAQFGLGAEIGISTQKLHARGPMGLRELTSYKWILKGHGQTRP